MVRSFSDFEANLTSVERIQEYCDLPQEVWNICKVYLQSLFIRKKIILSQKAPWEIEKTKPDKNWPHGGEIKFENYGLKYREELDFVLNGLNVHINAGEKVFIYF